MRRGMTISGAGFMGMIVVSWMSILVAGGAWMYSMYTESRDESARLRHDYYENRRNLVRMEVERAIDLVESIRRTALESLEQKVESRALAFRALTRGLEHEAVLGSAASAAKKVVLELMSVQDGAKHLYAMGGDTIYLFSPFPSWMDREVALNQVEAALKTGLAGSREISLRVPAGMGPFTLLTSVQEFDDPHVRIVSGACLEMAEEEVKMEVLRRLEAVRYAKKGTLFGGTFDGESLIGPAKGKNVWGVTDTNGVKVVQELIRAARRGGDFVTYIMPPFSGQRTATKVSYSKVIPDWHWYIGAGVFVDDIERVIELNREHLKQQLLTHGILIFSGMVLLGFIALYISFRLSRNIRHNIEFFTTVWDKAASGGGDIDASILHYAEFRELAAAANSMAADRQAAQEALSDSLQRFSMLVSNIPGIVYRCENGPNWESTFVSDSTLDITGYPAEEFIKGKGRNFYSIVHPEDLGWVSQAINEELKHRQTYMVDYRIIRKDGEIRWLSDRGRAVFNSRGEPVCLDGVIFDVTDRKKAEEEYYNHIHFLETMERIDRALHEDTDTDDMLSNTVEAVRQAFGADRAWLLYPCDPEALTYRVPVERTVPEYPGANAVGKDVPVDAATQEIFRLALASPVPLAFDPATGRSIDPGAVQVFQVKSQLIFAIRPRVGKPWLIGLHQCRDARIWNKDEVRLFMEAGRRLMEGVSSSLMLKELQESEELFRTFSEQTMLGLCVIQGDKILFVNQAFADTFETTVVDVMSLPVGGFDKYIHPDDREFVMAQVRKKQEGAADVVPSYSWRALTESGRIKWVETHSRTTRIGGRLADLVSLVDITASKRAGEELEAIIAERTSDLALKAAELKRANVELKKLDELKSAFLTTVSHAMRTPLTSVLGYAVLAGKDLEKIVSQVGTPDEHLARVVQHLEIMAVEGRRLHHLVNQFLELTDLEVWTDLRVEEVHPVADVIVRAVEDMRIRAGNDSEVELVLEREESLPELNVSPVHLEKVLLHLLDNAYRFTRKGRITVHAESLDGVGLELSVSDTGKGIPEEELEAIFKPFHQVETGDTLVDEIKGVGLGLAFCRMIIEKLGGKIWAESSPGKGATFFVTIPGEKSA